MKSTTAARGYQRKHRIARFKKRDRRRQIATYASSAAPITAALAAAPYKFTSHHFAPRFADCLGITTSPQLKTHFGPWIIATIASPGYEQQAHEFFTTLARYGNVPHARRLLLCVETNADLLAIAAAHDAVAVPLRAVRDVNASIKAALYSIARIAPAANYLCFDSDIFIVEDLRPLMATIEAQPQKIHAALSAATTANDQPNDYFHTARHYYNASQSDAEALLGAQRTEHFARLNSGVFGGSALSLFALDVTLRNHAHQVAAWINTQKSRAADELAFSLAVARLRGVAELPQKWNLQLYAQNVAPIDTEHHTGGNWPRFEFWHADERAAVLHFAAKQGREKLPFFRGLLALDRGD